jgi:hypothetical protein
MALHCGPVAKELARELLVDDDDLGSAGGVPFGEITASVQRNLEGLEESGRDMVLLGHSSIKITERHYAPWVQARQTQLEADLARVWRKDPLAQAEMLRGDTAIQDTAVRMAATYPRHEKNGAPN